MDKTAIKSYAIEARRKIMEAVKRKACTLNKELSPEKVEEIACTWFNRLIVLRIMEVNDWLPSNIRILSSREEGRLEPEAIREIDRLDFVDKELVAKLILDTDMNAVNRLYRHVLISQCKNLSQVLPGLFKPADSDSAYELLPDNLITKDGIIYDLITKIDESNFDLNQQGQIEIIGWLYQFYISEKKDKVFADLKKNIKINKETIPAATQLFTPEWIVKYLVENSLGRLWLERKDNPELKSNWKYYVEEAEQEPEVAENLKAMRAESPIKTPEDIKFIDPCMGSGHILVYAFEVMFQIYASEGYSERDIPSLILENNIYGLDIDDRACQLAYSALMMKARSKNRRFFRPGDGAGIPQPMVYSAKGDSELEEFGSLIKVEALGEEPDDVQKLTDGEYMPYEARLNSWNFRRLLSQKYDVVATNPPYMTPAPKQADWVKKNYPNSKSDLCVVFIERNFDLMVKNGYLAMITMHSWMFLSSYEKFRVELIKSKDIVNMAHLGAKAFEDIGGEVVQTTALVINNLKTGNFRSSYFRLVDYAGQDVKERKFFEASTNSNCSYFYQVTTDSFTKIPGNSIAYWIKKYFIKLYQELESVGKIYEVKKGMFTGQNDLFFRCWYEPVFNKVSFSITKSDDIETGHYVPMNSGGAFRRWYGNLLMVIKFDSKHYNLISQNQGHRSPQFYFKQAASWTKITSGPFSIRLTREGFINNDASMAIFEKDTPLEVVIALFNSKVAQLFLGLVNESLNYTSGNVASVPFLTNRVEDILKFSNDCIQISRKDWDSFETSWDFKRHSLLKVDVDTWWNDSEHKNNRIEDSYKFWQSHTESQFLKLKANEEELNRIFIDIYGLQDELTSEVDDKDVTVRKADLERDIRSFISYAVGCMFGRYSLDEEGLIFAGGDFDSSRYKTFAPVDDNIIPIGIKDYFDNDIVVRFTDFVQKVYGESTLGENLNFIAEALYPNGNGTTVEKLRRYFVTDFYKDHLKIYQKRPIYWLLDSGKKNGFKALIYLHRYNKYTMGIARTDYLHTQICRYENEINGLKIQVSEAKDTREKAIHQKQVTTLQAALDECNSYDQVIAYIAHQQIDLDLDDGVKVNYAKFQEIDVPKNDSGIDKMDLLRRI